MKPYVSDVTPHDLVTYRMIKLYQRDKEAHARLSSDYLDLSYETLAEFSRKLAEAGVSEDVKPPPAWACPECGAGSIQSQEWLATRCTEHREGCSGKSVLVRGGA